uniref:SPARC (osteonectin), cwcv and kazal like domains proteoglycan 1 n=1 Tax=Ornithorhynchus anatinus TaxID=9258 RepID=A0A6I8P2K8_ORNAN
SACHRLLLCLTSGAGPLIPPFSLLGSQLSKGAVAHRHWIGASNLVKCRPCPAALASSVCASDGHTYSSKCKLEFHACSSGKAITARCEGPCPCLPSQEPPKPKAERNACADKELRSLASRLKDWFRVVHADANRVTKLANSDSAQGRFDTSILPICKDSLGWMFNKLDMNYDLLLDHSEINTIYLEKYEPCIKPLFNSCDSFKDGKLSNNEWCYCFQKPGGTEIQKLTRGKNLLGVFIPRCTEEGYYKATQCHGSTGQCWCVDKYGNELAGSRKPGAVSCGESCARPRGSPGAVGPLSRTRGEEMPDQPSPALRVPPHGGNGALGRCRSHHGNQSPGDEH